ncbi:MAG: hypothetical protein ACJ76D_03400 [Solirubrobacterales bacterium]
MGSAYVAHFRSGRPIDLIRVTPDGERFEESEALRTVELPSGSRDKPLRVYYSPQAAIVVHDRGRHLITAPTPFGSPDIVRETLKGADFHLIAGFEPPPGETLIELEPLPGSPAQGLEPLTGEPVMAIEPPGDDTPTAIPRDLEYELRVCPGPPPHRVRLLPGAPFCPIHDRYLGSE